MDRGDLVPDEVTIAMVRDRLSEDDAQDGFLLDGFPRNVPQAEILKKMLADWGQALDLVLELVVDDDEVVRRLAGRRTCSQCGRIWHVEFDDKQDDMCDACGGALFQRDDDKEETVRHRLEVYQEQTSPLIVLLRGRGHPRRGRCDWPGRRGHPAGHGCHSALHRLDVTTDCGGGTDFRATSRLLWGELGSRLCPLKHLGVP